MLDRSSTDIYLEVNHLPAGGDKALLPHTSIHPGGVNGNFAANLASFGTSVTAVGSATSDPLAQHDLDDLSSRGVELRLDGTTAGPGNTCYVLVPSDGDRAILIDVAPDRARIIAGLRNALDSLGSPSFDLGYVGVWGEHLLDNMSSIRERVSTLATTLEISTLRNGIEDVPFDWFDIVFCADETFDPFAEALESAAIVHNFELVVTRGAAGSQLRARSGWTTAPAAASPLPVVDTTGAGDCFAAAYCGAILRGEAGLGALTTANLAARQTVAHLGARPSLLSQQLRQMDAGRARSHDQLDVQ
ncbi:carbohydrate kinase family protein [Amycolatopsis sp. GM8]|uniref:carbohydrate kinase family protein n=1 Tax=Amycolatopsis sp. GM8 TaxID=2896530 RepID=UPI001F26D20D|nr:carbohydrate kinase family protein [Amycolatopsis sp. GM8]